MCQSEGTRSWDWLGLRAGVLGRQGRLGGAYEDQRKELRIGGTQREGTRCHKPTLPRPLRLPPAQPPPCPSSGRTPPLSTPAPSSTLCPAPGPPLPLPFPAPVAQLLNKAVPVPGRPQPSPCPRLLPHPNSCSSLCPFQCPQPSPSPDDACPAPCSPSPPHPRPCSPHPTPSTQLLSYKSRGLVCFGSLSAASSNDLWSWEVLDGSAACGGGDGDLARKRQH